MRVFVRPVPGTPLSALPEDTIPETADPLGRPALRIAAGPRAVPAELRPGDHVLLTREEALDAEVDRIRAAGAHPWAVAGSVAEVRRAAAAGAGLWLRGLEAGGRVGDCAALVLVRAAAPTGRRWVCEGLSVRAMAAALALGADGIVLDAALWLTRESPLPEDHRALLRAVSSGHDTAVDGELGGVRRRTVSRGSARLDAPQNVADARRFDGRPVAEAVRELVAEVRSRRARIDGAGLAEDPLGCGRPVVQGPMANVAEGTGLARAVRAAGALPFAALGALDPDQAREVLARWAAEVPGPWGAGVIGFDVMPHRDAHLDAISALGDRGPAVVTLAGASPALAIELERRGLRIWLHTPSARLAEQALAAGVSGIVLEGHEAGGHVGRLTSVGLWEEGLAAAAAGPGEATVVLAGGIGDEVSAAFAAAMAHDHRRVVLQAGTAFLLTHEAVEQGQVTPIYQARALGAASTVLVGSTVNLPLRCVPNPFTERARADEQDWEARGVPRSERRERLERNNLGRTRIAAKGIERNPDAAPRYRVVPPARQDREGAFTVGQGALVTGRLQSVGERVRAMTDGARALLATEDGRDLAGRPGTTRGGGEAAPSPAASGAGVSRPRPRWRSVSTVAGRARFEAPAVIRSVSERGRDGDIAIVGLGCVLPGALDVPSFHRNLVEGVDAVGPIPEDRWPAHRYFDPEAHGPGQARSYTRHAGVVRGFAFDPLPFRIPPRVVPTIDPSQRLALAAAAEAVASAGLDRARIDRRRAAVVVGNAMGGEFAKSLAVRVRFRDVIAAVAEDELGRGLSVADLAALEDRIERALAPRLPPVEIDSMAGLLSNVVAGRIAAWLDWMGGNLTVDAACAASLAAVAVAVDWLRLGRCDLVLAGGVDTDLTPETFVGFCRTEALSPRGSSPFSTRADGFVMGEGAAMFVLKRLSDAERAGDPVWAVIRGVGWSSDGRGRGITAPRPEGQALALERAYAEAGLEPRDLGLVEAHGTGTALGDETEVGVLARAFAGARGPIWLGSVKSMIGHLKSAAGAAGLLKATLALRTGVVPPTLHAAPFSPGLALGSTPFRLPRAPTGFPEGRRRASVSAFGFGGTNYHLVLDLPGGPAPRPAATMAAASRDLVLPAEVAAWSADEDTPVLHAFGAATPEALIRAVRAGTTAAPEEAAAAPARVVVLAAPARTDAVFERVLRWLESGADGSAATSDPTGGSRSTWPRESGERGAGGRALGREAFLGWGPPEPVVLAFPGQGAQRDGAVDALARIPVGARALARVDQAVRDLLGDGVALRDRRGADPLTLHAVLFGLEVGWAAVLREAGVPLAAVIGHSLGGYAALVAAGAATADDLVEVVLARGRALAACPPGSMVAVRSAADDAEALAARFGLAVAALNAPDQVVLSGAPEQVGALAAELGPGRAKVLEVERAYHSPLVAPAVEGVRATLGRVRLGRAEVPIWSARTAAEATDPADDLVRGILEPVRFDPAVRALVGGGRRTWVEAGPGTTLTRIVERAGGLAIPLDPGDGGVAVAAAALLARGHAGLARLLPGTLVEHALPAAPEPARGAASPAEVSAGASARARSWVAASAGAPSVGANSVGAAPVPPTAEVAASAEAGSGSASAGAASTRAASAATAAWVGARWRAEPAEGPGAARWRGEDRVDLQEHARRVQDLRIAALDNPALQDLYEQARAALLAELAARDAADLAARDSGSGRPAPEVGAREPLVRGGAMGPDPRLPTPEGAEPVPLAARLLREPTATDARSPPQREASEGEAEPRSLAASEPSGTGVPEDEVRAAVVAAICEVTGYPPELVTDGADLEGDLGVDSIRKMEILGALEKRFGIATADADYATLAEADLGKLVAHVRARRQAQRPSPALGRAFEPAPDPAGSPPSPTQRGSRPDEVGIAVLVPRRAGPSGLGRAVGDVVHVPEGREPLEVVDALATMRLPDPLAAVAPLDLGGAAAVGWLRSAARELGRELIVLRPTLRLARERLVAELATRTARVPGGPGSAGVLAGSSGVAAGSSGVAPESAEVAPGSEGSAAGQSGAVAGSAGVPAGSAAAAGTERFLDGQGAWELAPLAVDPAESAPWPDRPVILATGGARGILVPCLAALGPLRPRVVLLARSSEGDPEVAGALERLRAEGIEVVYHPGDVTIADDVLAAARGARARWERIDVVVHAAGVLRDGPLVHQTAADRAAVLAVKWDGARHLVDATRDDPLVAFVTFSSVVAHLGNPGQTAYGAANAALETVVHPTARTVSLAWTAWSEVGMAADPRLQAVLAARGVRSLSPGVGAEAFRRVVRSELTGTVLVTADPLPSRVPVGWPLGTPTVVGSDRIVVPVPLDPATRALADHRVGGRPLVPAATWVAALLEAAALLTGEAGRFAVDGLDILAPTFVDRARDDVRLELVRDGDGFGARITAGSAEVCRARISAWTSEPAGDPSPPLPLVDAEPAGPLYRPDLLFHGPAWQVLRQVRIGPPDGARGSPGGEPGGGPVRVDAEVELVEAGQVAAEAELVAPERVAGGPSAVASVVDGVHQLLAAWSGRSVGWLGLPVGADRWVARVPAAGLVRVETVARATARELRAQVIGRDSAGRVVLRGEGVRLRAAGRVDG